MLPTKCFKTGACILRCCVTTFYFRSEELRCSKACPQPSVFQLVDERVASRTFLARNKCVFAEVGFWIILGGFMEKAEGSQRLRSFSKSSVFVAEMRFEMT